LENAGPLDESGLVKSVGELPLTGTPIEAGFGNSWNRVVLRLIPPWPKHANRRASRRSLR